MTVAIFDTGVDPAASGLQTTSDGLRKIVDLVDCTSSGDVDTSRTALLSPTSTLQGLSGRELRVPPQVASLNPKKTFHIGLKHAYDFFPVHLTRRIRRERRDRWDRSHRPIVSAARLSLSRLRRDNAPAAQIDDADARLAALVAAEKHYRDTGPFFDVIVFHDGTNWRAIVDTSESGDLSRCDLLENYAIHGRYSSFPNGVMLNFAVNVYNSGDILSIVVDCGSHGTHVAGILAANFPDAPHLNGIAPGARIVSLKIGDARLSSMETHQGLVRALAYCMRRGPRLGMRPRGAHSGADGEDVTAPLVPAIDLINMSFGEHSRDVDRGRFVDLVNRLVRRHGVLFVSSAGNEGPALSSVSAPGGTTSAMIGVGAFSTPDMLMQAYSYLDSEYGEKSATTNDGETVFSASGDGDGIDSAGARVLPSSVCSGPNRAGEHAPVVGMPYTWSSRGPVPNGALGVSVCAPGGAIAPIPVWNLRKKQLMHGTSMSSPSAAGAIAVVLSFLKARNMPYSTALVRRAIENTARPLVPIRQPGNAGGEGGDGLESRSRQDLAFATGYGCIDAMAACEYLERYMEKRVAVAPGKDAHGESETKSASADIAKTVSDASDAKVNNISVAGKGNKGSKVYRDTLEDCGDSSFHLQDWHLSISVEDGSSTRRGTNSSGVGVLNSNRGVYLRGSSDTNSVRRIQVMVEPVGHDTECEATKKALSEMEIHLSLVSQSSWVHVPKSVVFLGGGRSFVVIVDPTQLAAGRAHYTEVMAFVRKSESGPVFRIPITVIKPEPLVGGSMIRPIENVSFEAGSVLRRFYESPSGATFAVLRVTAGDEFVCEGGAPAVEHMAHNERTNGINTISTATVKSSASESGGDGASLAPPVAQGQRGGASGTGHVLPPAKQLGGGYDVDGELTPPPTPAGPTPSSSSLSNTRAESTHSKSGKVRQFEVHVAQFLPQKHCGELESRHYLTLHPGVVKECIVSVEDLCTFELCVAQMWSSAGHSRVSKVELIFGGVVPRPNALYAPVGAPCFPPVHVASHLPGGLSRPAGALAVSGYSPRASLTHLHRVIVPKSSDIIELSERDALPDGGKLFQLRLDYAFEVHETLSTVRVTFPWLNRAVYEAEIEGGPYVIIHDHDLQYLHASDIYPGEHAFQKGEYVATAYIRHEQVEVLELLRQTRMTVEYDLSSEITLDLYESAHAACLGIDKRKVSRAVCTLESGERRAFHFSVPKRSSMPKWAAAGDLLVGNMTVDKLLSGGGSGPRRGNDMPSYPVSMSVGPSNSSPSPLSSPSSSSSSSSGTTASVSQMKKGSEAEVDGSCRDRLDAEEEEDDQDKKVDDTNPGKSEGQVDAETVDKEEEGVGWLESNKDEWMQDALRKLRMKRLRSLLKEKKMYVFHSLYVLVRQQYPDDVEPLLIRMEWADAEASRISGEVDGGTAEEALRSAVGDVVACCDALVGMMDVDGIAKHFGCNVDPDDEKATAKRKMFEKKKQQLVEGLFRKARALSLLAIRDGIAVKDEDVQGGGVKESEGKGCNNDEESKNGVEEKEGGVEDGKQEGEGKDEEKGKRREEGKDARTKHEREMFEAAMKEVMKWVGVDGRGSMPGGGGHGMRRGSTSNEDLMVVSCRREALRGRLGVALRVMDNFYGAGGSKRVEAEEALQLRERVYTALGWEHLAERERNYTVKRFAANEMAF